MTNILRIKRQLKKVLHFSRIISRVCTHTYGIFQSFHMCSSNDFFEGVRILFNFLIAMLKNLTSMVILFCVFFLSMAIFGRSDDGSSYFDDLV